MCRGRKLHLNILAGDGSIVRAVDFGRFQEYCDSERLPGMRTTTFRGIVLGALSLALMFPAGEMRALAQAKNPQQTQPQQPQNPGDFAISVTVPVVSVDVVVTDNSGNFLNGLKKENFRISDDGVTQAITNFAPTDAPITIVLLLEFSARGGGLFTYNSANWAAQFLNNLKPTDWVALETFSLTPTVEVDFTHSPNEILDGLRSLVFPPFHEANLFDAIADTVDRMKDVKGKKAILVLAQGIDTFSKLTLDKITQRLRDTDVTIFPIGVGEFQFLINDSLDPGTEPSNRMNYLQAQNEMRTFAAMTGGRAWFPRFEGEIPGIMADVAGSLRNQYSLAYTPSNATTDGKYHKIKVELVAPDGGPLAISDQKGKKVKFQVYARQGYTAPKSAVN
jgi:VWFA-related protein